MDEIEEIMSNKKVLNLSLLEGRLVEDPELMKSLDESTVCAFYINVRTNAGLVKTISVLTRNAVAEACGKYLKKGTKVRVRGILRKEDGKLNERLFIESSNVELLRSIE